jgi:predicted CXXCH cytochrome family protein
MPRLHRALPIIATAAIAGTYGFAPLLLQPVKPIQIVAPPTSRALVKDNSIAVAGQVGDPGVKGIVMFREEKSERWFQLEALEFRKGFVAEVGQFWREEMLGGALAITAIRGKSDSSVVTFTWDLAEATTQQTFWRTKAGAKLIGVANDPLVRSVRLVLKGWIRTEAILSPSAAGRWFSATEQLSPGENVITIAATDARGAVTSADTLRVYYYIETFADRSSGFEKYTFHGSPAEPACAGCHPRRPAAARDACSPCHDGLVTQRYTHTPSKKRLCMACHDSSSTPAFQIQKRLGSDAELCYNCHTRQKVAWSADTMNRHAPVDAGTCLQCHSPHGTPNVEHTLMPINAMCKSCHEQMDEFLHPVVGHPHQGRPEGKRPGREMSCAGCHEPHATAAKKMLRYGPGMAGCGACHKK